MCGEILGAGCRGRCRRPRPRPTPPDSRARTSIRSPGAVYLIALSRRFSNASDSRSQSPRNCGSGQGARGRSRLSDRSAAPGCSRAISTASASRAVDVDRPAVQLAALDVGDLAQVGGQPAQPEHLRLDAGRNASWSAPGRGRVTLARAAPHRGQRVLQLVVQPGQQQPAVPRAGRAPARPADAATARPARASRDRGAATAGRLTHGSQPASSQSLRGARSARPGARSSSRPRRGSARHAAQPHGQRRAAPASSAAGCAPPQAPSTTRGEAVAHPGHRGDQLRATRSPPPAARRSSATRVSTERVPAWNVQPQTASSSRSRVITSSGWVMK